MVVRKGIHGVDHAAGQGLFRRKLLCRLEHHLPLLLTGIIHKEFQRDHLARYSVAIRIFGAEIDVRRGGVDAHVDIVVLDGIVVTILVGI